MGRVRINLLDGHVVTLSETIAGLPLPASTEGEQNTYWGRTKKGFNKVLQYLRDNVPIEHEFMEEFLLLGLMKDPRVCDEQTLNGHEHVRIDASFLSHLAGRSGGNCNKHVYKLPVEGSINFSRIDSAQLRLFFKDEDSGGQRNGKVTVVNRYMNVLRLLGGMADLAYIN